MKISTKGRYALRMMLDIAMNDANDNVKIKDIAARQNISDKYLEQIITMLNKAGYVKSMRGAFGGYRLTQKPEEYTVGMILRLAEGSLAPVACLEREREECARLKGCATFEVYKRINEAVNSVIDTMTLRDLMEIQKKKDEEET